MATFPFQDQQPFFQLSTDERLKRTFFLIEATDNEKFSLWERWGKDSTVCRGLFLDWQQGLGNIIVIGDVNGLPVAICLQWDFIEGKPVCFWHPTSQMVDYELIQNWLKEHFTAKTKDGRPATCNVDNFHFLTGELDLSGRPDYDHYNLARATALLREAQDINIHNVTAWAAFQEKVNAALWGDA